MTVETAPPQAKAAHAPMSVFGAAALVAGSMIGSGIYLLPASLGATGSISLLGWVLATAVALVLAGMFAQLAAVAPQARGVSGYVEAGLGRFFAAQATVAYWASCWVGVAALVLAAAGYAGFLIPALAPLGPRLATMLVLIWASVGACWLGPRVVGRVEGVTLVAGLAPVLLIAIAGWLWFDPAVFARSWNPTGLSVFAATRSSALTAFWAFLGLECAAAAAGAVRDPVRNVPRATMGGVAIAATLYVAACAVLMGLMPAAELAKSSAPFADATRAILGVGGAGMIAVCAFLRTAGCTTGWVLVTAETSREAADQRAFPPAFRTRPGERGSAVNLIATGLLMSAVCLLTASPTLGSQFSAIANVTVVLSLLTYLMAAFSLFRQRERASGPRQRAVATATSILSILCVGGLLASASLHDLGLSLISVALAAGLYLALRRR